MTIDINEIVDDVHKELSDDGSEKNTGEQAETDKTAYLQDVLWQLFEKELKDYKKHSERGHVMVDSDIANTLCALNLKRKNLTDLVNTILRVFIFQCQDKIKSSIDSRAMLVR